MARPKLAPLRTSRGSKPPPRPGQFACPAAAPQNVQDVCGHAELTRPVRWPTKTYGGSLGEGPQIHCKRPPCGPVPHVSDDGPGRLSTLAWLTHATKPSAGGGCNNNALPIDRP